MKKILAIILTICLMASVLCITAVTSVAADDTSKSSTDVILVRGLKKGMDMKDRDALVTLGSFTSYEEGWSKAAKYAKDENFMKDYDRIVVDLLADWNSVGGYFADEPLFEDDPGFKWDTIYIGSNVRMMINMNGHTIDRKLTDDISNGEVIYIDEDADVIINGGQYGDPIVKLGENPGDVKMGTITGGYSWNGAGGIHINDKANVVLNNVILKGNSVNRDDGMAIAVYDHAILTMNGGKIVDNKGDHAVFGAVYVNDADATLNDVLISGNEITTNYVGRGSVCAGGAGCVDGGTLTFNNCTITNNHCDRIGGAIGVLAGNAYLNECIVTENSAGIDGSAIAISGVGTCTATNCDLTGNVNTKWDSVFYADTGTIYIIDSKYDNKLRETGGKIIVSSTTEAPKEPASVFGEGSVAMIVACVALLTSAASIFVVFYNKKKLEPKAEKTEE